MGLNSNLTSRRGFLRGAGGGAAAALAFPMLGLGSHKVSAASSARYSTRAIDLVRSSLVIDMLAPLTLDFSPDRWAETLPPEGAAMYRHSGITAFHNSISTQGPEVFADTLHYMASWNGFAARNSDLFLLVDKAGDLDKAKASNKIALIMGVQNSEHFRTAADVKMFWNLGQRCSQLTYNWQNRLGSGSTERVDGGLSDFGIEIIKAMNEVGMLVDVSHCGDRTTLDAIEASAKPVAITHSNCRGINDHPRLKTDEAIKKCVARGGVMGITGIRNFVRDREPTTIEHLIDHVDYAARLVGIENIGIGSDADLHGYDDMKPEYAEMLRASQKPSYKFRDKKDIEGFDHPQKMYDLTEGLIRRGYSDTQIRGVLGGNFRRLLGQIWG